MKAGEGTVARTGAAGPASGLACPLCGGPNACVEAACALAASMPGAGGGSCCEGGAGAHGPCWCRFVDMPQALLSRLPPGSRACICRDCVARERRGTRWMPAAQAGEFYLLDDGRLVFTERYHLRRGYCCGSGCRHCPFDEGGRPRAEVLEALGGAS